MDRIISKLLVYGDIDPESILMKVGEICAEFRSGRYDETDLITRCYKQTKRILEVSTDYGFDRNLWQCYLTFLLITDENPFTLTSEKVGAKDGSVNHFVKNDYKMFMQLFHYSFKELEEKLGIDCFSTITDYKAIGKPELMYNKNVSEQVNELSLKLSMAEDEEEFFTLMTDFYKAYGVGLFGLNKAFRIEKKADGDIYFRAINNMDKVMLCDLIGYEAQKAKLVENTKAFVEGRKANNCLLFGDSGTGKSTSVKAIVNEFYESGLRMIEIYKHQFKDLSGVIAKIKNRNYRFIIYMDDLSFEDFEVEYKFLKAVIEGGVESKPENILIYATSNRRHLVKETWKDRDDVEINGGLHSSDSMEEKLSLARRFGCTIYYSKPGKNDFDNIVINLARRNNIDMDDAELIAEANKWELSHGGRSGRTAAQFITHLLGQMEN